MFLRWYFRIKNGSNQYLQIINVEIQIQDTKNVVILACGIRYMNLAQLFIISNGIGISRSSPAFDSISNKANIWLVNSWNEHAVTNPDNNVSGNIIDKIPNWKNPNKN